MLRPDLKLTHCCYKCNLSETLGLKLIPGDAPVQYHHRGYVIAQNGYSFSTEQFAPQFQSHHNGQQLKCINMKVSLHDELWEFTMKEVTWAPTPAAFQAGIRGKHFTWSGSDQGESGIMDIKNNAWVTVNNDFWVTSEAIGQ